MSYGSPAEEPESRRSSTPEESPEFILRPPWSRERMREEKHVVTDRLYSLGEAARVLGMHEDAIRGAVLVGDLPAEAVADERDYLITGESLELYRRSLRPEGVGTPERDSGVGSVIAIFAVVAILAIVMSLACRGTPTPAGTRVVGPPAHSFSSGLGP